MTDFVVVIPARYASTRLPGKPLREINGKPMLEHVWLRGKESDARDVVIATDDERVALAAESFGATVCMTGDQHRSGTERIAEVSGGKYYYQEEAQRLPDELSVMESSYSKLVEHDLWDMPLLFLLAILLLSVEWYLRRSKGLS